MGRGPTRAKPSMSAPRAIDDTSHARSRRARRSAALRSGRRVPETLASANSTARPVLLAAKTNAFGRIGFRDISGRSPRLSRFFRLPRHHIDGLLGDPITGIRVSHEIGLGNLCSFRERRNGALFAIRARSGTPQRVARRAPSSRSTATVERFTPTHTARVAHNLSARRDPFVRLGKMMSLASTAASVPVTRASGARPRAQRNAGNGPAPKVREAVIETHRGRPALELHLSSRCRPVYRTPTAASGRYPVDREFPDAPSSDRRTIERAVH